MARETNFATTSTTSSATATLVTATLVALTGTSYQIVGFDGSSSDQPFAVALKFGSVTRFTMQGSADTTVGRDFGEIGHRRTPGERDHPENRFQFYGPRSWPAIVTL